MKNDSTAKGVRKEDLAMLFFIVPPKFKKGGL